MTCVSYPKITVHYGLTVLTGSVVRFITIVIVKVCRRVIVGLSALLFFRFSLFFRRFSSYYAMLSCVFRAFPGRCRALFSSFAGAFSTFCCTFSGENR